MGMVEDGFKTTLAIEGVSNKFEELSIKPGSIIGGTPNSRTTMRNTNWHTKSTQTLKELGAFTLKVFYDVAVLDQMKTLVNQNKLMTITFADLDTWAFYGTINQIDFDEIVVGKPPEATITITPTLRDASGTETAPVRTVGTTTTTTTTTAPA